MADHFRPTKLGPADWASSKTTTCRAPQQQRPTETFLLRVTLGLPELLARCDAEYTCLSQTLPRRVLTAPEEGVHNNGWANIDYDYIARVGDVLKAPSGREFEIIDGLGKGSFGQVFRCKDCEVSTCVAIKVTKSKKAYLKQAKSEVAILEHLRKKILEGATEDGSRIIGMLGYFRFRGHLCVVLEMMSSTLLDVLKARNFKAMRMAPLHTITVQLLEGVRFLRECNVIHCDLKPENVMLVSNTRPVRLRIVDFGSACWAHTPTHRCLQSLFYRAPEALLGLPYNAAIDMWSLGCICAEMCMGPPLFPARSEYDLISKIAAVLGLPPEHMLARGAETKKYFKRVDVGGPAAGGDDRTAGLEAGTVPDNAAGDAAVDAATPGSAAAAAPTRTASQAPLRRRRVVSHAEQSQPDVTEAVGAWNPPGAAVDETARSRNSGGTRPRRHSLQHLWRVKTKAEYEADEREEEKKPGRQLQFTSFQDMVDKFSDESWHEERKPPFLQLLAGLLAIDPQERWTPNHAMAQSFANPDVPYDEQWQPPRDELAPPVQPPSNAGSCCSSASSVLTASKSGSSVSGDKGSCRGQHSDALSSGSMAASSTTASGSSSGGGSRVGPSSRAEAPPSCVMS